MVPLHIDRRKNREEQWGVHGAVVITNFIIFHTVSVGDGVGHRVEWSQPALYILGCPQETRVRVP